MHYKIGFIGAGQMATALAAGTLRAKVFTAQEIALADISPDAIKRFTEIAAGTQVLDSNEEIIRNCSTVVLAVKPQHVASALEGVQDLKADPLFISIAAGVPLETLEGHLGESARCVRVMPNTPCLIGCGASAFAGSPHTTAHDVALVEQIFGSVGMVEQVPEKLLDGVTGLSGSGPAFVYTMIEALSDGGVASGLPRDLATRLAVATVQGAASMVDQSGEHPAVLRDRVTSPAGTTVAGLDFLERHAVRGALAGAVTAAAQRATEISQEYTTPAS